jgi:hypothetical protein
LVCASVAELENTGQLALDHDSQLALHRHQPNRLDEGADDIEGLITGRGVMQLGAECWCLIELGTSARRSSAQRLW